MSNSSRRGEPARGSVSGGYCWICLICMSEMRDASLRKFVCTPLTKQQQQQQQQHEEVSESHAICQACLTQYAKEVAVGQIAAGGVGLSCVVPCCSNTYLWQHIKPWLPAKQRTAIESRLQRACLLTAELSELVQCPGCGYQGLIEQDALFYYCVCGRQQCRNCNLAYNSMHRGRTCFEIREQLKSLNKLEDRLSEILIRRCHRCGIPFVKKGGCNYITCICGANQCYLCRKQDVNYHHFNDSTCRLFASSDYLDRKKMAAAKARDRNPCLSCSIL